VPLLQEHGVGGAGSFRPRLEPARAGARDRVAQPAERAHDGGRVLLDELDEQCRPPAQDRTRAAQDVDLGSLDVDLHDGGAQHVARDLEIERRRLVDCVVGVEAPVHERRPRRVALGRYVQRPVPERVGRGDALHRHVPAVVERQVLLELRAGMRVRLEREHAAALPAGDVHAVHADVRADADEVAAASQEPLDQAQLELVAEAEEVVAVERLGEVEAEARAEEVHVVHARPGHADTAAQPALARKLDAPGDGENGGHPGQVSFVPS